MPTIETYRKQAKLLLRWHREKDYSIGGRVRKLERYQSLTDCEVLALKFTLTQAQEIIAIEAGYRNWAELKAATAGALRTPRISPGQPFLKDVIPILLVRDGGPVPEAGCPVIRGLEELTTLISPPP